MHGNNDFSFLVIFFSISWGLILPVKRSTSAKTGLAPTWMITLAVETNVNGVVITSSPGPIPKVFKPKCIVAVAEFTATDSLT